MLNSIHDLQVDLEVSSESMWSCRQYLDRKVIVTLIASIHSLNYWTHKGLPLPIHQELGLEQDLKS